MLLCMKNDSQSIMEEIELIFEKEKKFWGMMQNNRMRLER